MTWEEEVKLAMINLKLARDWTHVKPSEKQSRVEECWAELDRLLDQRLAVLMR